VSTPADQPSNPWPLRLARVLLVLALCWAVAVAWGIWDHLPHVPIDLDPNDPDVEAAFRAALTRHVLRQALVALAPLFVALALYVIAARRRR
jgi:hypothetical protein